VELYLNSLIILHGSVLLRTVLHVSNCQHGDDANSTIIFIQGVPGGMCQTSGGCSLC